MHYKFWVIVQTSLILLLFIQNNLTGGVSKRVTWLWRLNPAGGGGDGGGVKIPPLPSPESATGDY